MQTPSSRHGNLAGPSGLPFDDVRAVLSHFPEPDSQMAADVRARLSAIGGGVTMGDLTERAAWLAAITATTTPTLGRVDMALFVANSTGVAPEPESALSILEALSSGCHLTSQLCQRAGVGLKVYDLALEVATPDPRQDAAMTEQECAATMAFGMEATAGLEGLVLGRAGAGGEVLSFALLQLLTPQISGLISAAIEEPLGRVALEIATAHDSAAHDPFEALRRAGGRDLAAMVGAIMAARSQRMPVIVEGMGGLAAAAILAKAGAGNLDHCLFADADLALLAAARTLGMAQVVQTTAAGEGVAGLLAFHDLQAAVDSMQIAQIIHQARHG